ncbi:hypothetical protein BJV74DRAFT_889043 [Russula compacta]|nr:hypothetical protein BJV74DRAFT_889043 [Russula compacta]
MSNTHVTATSSSNFQLIFSHALETYEKQTKKDLLAHPLAAQLQSCDSPSTILALLHQQVQDLNQSRNNDEKLTRWLDPTVNVIYAFSDTLGEGVSLVFSPAKVIFAGVGVLLLVAKDVRASQETLVDIFERIEHFFARLAIYTEVPPTPQMVDIMVKIMVEVLFILGVATKEIKQGRTKKYLKKLVGRTDVEDALKRLDQLTHEEARMATAQVLKATNAVDDRVRGVADKVLGVDDRVAGVDTRVASIDDRIKAVDNKVAVVVDDGKEAKALMQRATTDLDMAKQNQMRQDLRKWLSPPDTSTNHNIACGAHHEGTATWFFQGSIFNEWKSTGSLLWIHGKPGSGKSVLCSSIIEDIATMCKAGQASMCYFYFDFRDTNKQTWHDLLPSLLIQLSARSEPRCDILSRLYLDHDSGAQKPSDDALIKCLKKMLTLPDQRPIYIILDALDECPNTPGIPSPANAFFAFRPEFDIRDVLEPLTSFRVSLHDQSGQKEDILDYVRSIVHSDSELIMKRWRTEDKDLVIETLSERADGIVRRTLEELPESLDETYERILKEIKKPNRDHAHRLLQCLVVASRPLGVEELAEVLAVDYDDDEGIPRLNSSWRWEDHEQALLSSCSSLIAIVEADSSRVVQFSHFSVKEFLTSPRLATSRRDVSRYYVDLEAAHTILAQACIGVLLRLDDGVDKTGVGQRFPLASYAARYWTSHGQFKDVSIRLRKGMEYLFDMDEPHFAAWLRLCDIDTQPRVSSTFYLFAPYSKSGATPLYYAALCGFHDLVEHLIVKYPQHVNGIGGYYVRPLIAALAGRHFQVAGLLRRNGADPNVRARERRITPLHSAAYYGNVEVVQKLIEYDGDVDARENDGYTPLNIASEGVNLKDPYAFRLLLENGADVDARTKDGSTPLHRASLWGALEVARILLEHGASVEAKDNLGRTPLQVAPEKHRDAIMKLLLDHGAK